MFLTNAKYLDNDFRLVKGDIEIDGGVIKAVGEKLPYSAGDMAVDCEGYTIVPGFVDVHIHGCDGADTCDGTPEAIEKMARFLLSHGVTSFCPTTMTIEREVIEKALLAARTCAGHPIEDGARVVGINMEGPFISREKKGAQRESAILKPDIDLFRHFFELSGGLVRLIDIAPEQPGGYEFVREAKKLCTVSIAHTTATYDEAIRAFDEGVTHATHLFNAMPGLHHRDPGVVGAVFHDERVRAEIICDGIHIHPAVLCIAFRQLAGRIMVISDSLRANGMEEGDSYELGGQMVTVKNGKATLKDGTIAGSVSNLHQEVKNLVGYGVPFETAVRAATLTPAQAIGLDREIGSIAPGKRADLVVLDKSLDIVGVYHS